MDLIWHSKTFKIVVNDMKLIFELLTKTGRSELYIPWHFSWSNTQLAESYTITEIFYIQADKIACLISCSKNTRTPIIYLAFYALFKFERILYTKKQFSKGKLNRQIKLFNVLIWHCFQVHLFTLKP